MRIDRVSTLLAVAVFTTSFALASPAVIRAGRSDQHTFGHRHRRVGRGHSRRRASRSRTTRPARSRRAVTAENGTFSVPALNAGTYTVTVTLVGFKTVVLNDVVLNAGVPASVRAVARGRRPRGARRRSERQRARADADLAGVEHAQRQHAVQPAAHQPRGAEFRCRPGRRQYAGRHAGLHDQRTAAEHDQHHPGRHEHPGQLAQDDGRVLRATQSQPGRRRGSHGDDRRQRRRQRGPGGREHPNDHAVGIERSARQRLLLPAA